MLVVPPVLGPSYWVPPRKRPHCLPIEPEDVPALPELVARMAQYCRDHEGAGLAAPQIGIYKSLAILLSPKNKVSVLINPEIVSYGGRDILDVEGCLSLPPSRENQFRVRRSEKIEVECGTEEDPHARVRTAHTGQVARIIQHEVDHLNPDGEVFFIDRIGALARGQALRKFLKFSRRQEVRSAS